MASLAFVSFLVDEIIVWKSLHGFSFGCLVDETRGNGARLVVAPIAPKHQHSACGLVIARDVTTWYVAETKLDIHGEPANCTEQVHNLHQGVPFVKDVV